MLVYWVARTVHIQLPTYPNQVHVQVYGSGPALVAIGLLALRFGRPVLGIASLGLGIYWIGAIIYELYTEVG